MKVNLTILLVLVFITGYTQGLGSSKKEIVQTYGTNYTECDDVPCIFYVTDKLDKAGNTYESCKAYYFDKNSVCKLITYIEPIRQINAWIKAFQDLGYVPINELKYKDYASGTIWELERTTVGDINSVRVKVTYDIEE